MGDRLATIDMGWKVGGCVPLGGCWVPIYIAQCRLGRGLPLYQMTSWSIQSFGHNIWAEKYGGCCPPFWGGSWPHLRQCRLGRGLPPYQVASWSIHSSRCLARTDMGRKLGWRAVPFFWGGGAGSRSNTMWPGTSPTSVPSFYLDPPNSLATKHQRYTDRQDRTDRKTVRQHRANSNRGSEPPTHQLGVRGAL